MGALFNSLCEIIRQARLTDNKFGFISVVMVLSIIALFLLIYFHRKRSNTESAKSSIPIFAFLIMFIILVASGLFVFITINEATQHPKVITTDVPPEPMDKDSSTHHINKPPKPKRPTLDASKYFDTQGRKINVAVLLTGNLKNPATSNQVADYLEGEYPGLQVSSTFFRAPFEKDFGSALTEGDIERLGNFGLKSRLDCICLIDQAITTDSNAYKEHRFISRHGDYQIKLLNFKAGRVNSFSLRENGAGLSMPSARDDLDRKFFIAFKSLNLLITQCKN